MMAFSAAIEPLRSANRMSERRLFEWKLVSVDGREVVGQQWNRHRRPQAPSVRLSKTDMLVVCAGSSPRSSRRATGCIITCAGSRATAPWSARSAPARSFWPMPDCSIGRRCTVHWEYADLFRSRYPAAQGEPRSLYRRPRCVHLLRRHGGARHDAAFRRRGIDARDGRSRSPSNSSTRDSPAGGPPTPRDARPLWHRQSETRRDHRPHGDGNRDIRST